MLVKPGSFIKFCWQTPVLVKNGQNNTHMNTYTFLCVLPEHISLNMYHSKTCREKLKMCLAVFSVTLGFGRQQTKISESPRTLMLYILFQIRTISNHAYTNITSHLFIETTNDAFYSQIYRSNSFVHMI